LRTFGSVQNKGFIFHGAFFIAPLAMEKRKLEIEADLDVRQGDQRFKVGSSEDGSELQVQFDSSHSLLQSIRSVRQREAMRSNPREKLNQVNQFFRQTGLSMVLQLSGRTLLQLGRHDKPRFNNRLRIFRLAIRYLLGGGKARPESEEPRSSAR
jgi:hypothetical protein